jgi:hypothetical protein
MARLRKKLGLAAAACAAIVLLAGSALAGNPNAPGAGNGNASGNGKSPAKGGTPPGQAKKGTNGHQGNGHAYGKAKAKHGAHVSAKPSHPAHPVHPLTPMPQGSVHSQAPPMAPAKGRGHEKTAQHKVIICHRTGSSTNPYVVINISINAWQHGHTTHPALDGRSDILLQDPARPGEKLDASQCPGAGQQQGSAGTSGGVGGDQQLTAGHVANAKARTGAGGVLGATATSRPKATPRSGTAGAGVLGAFSSRVTRGQLPFTGLPLWPAALIAAALMAAGLIVRRRGHEPV